MCCSCGFILQSSCSRFISCPLYWYVYSVAPQIFWSSVYCNILHRHISICCCCCCEAAGRNKRAESFHSVKMASKWCNDHCTQRDCFGENLCMRNFCSVPSPFVCGSPEDVTMVSTLRKGCRMTDLTFSDCINDLLQSVVFRHDCCRRRIFDNTR